MNVETKTDIKGYGYGAATCLVKENSFKQKIGGKYFFLCLRFLPDMMCSIWFSKIKKKKEIPSGCSLSKPTKQKGCFFSYFRNIFYFKSETLSNPKYTEKKINDKNPFQGRCFFAPFVYIKRTLGGAIYETD